MRKKLEKYILTKKVHLGYIKDTFEKGTVLTVDRKEGTVTTEGGRKFDDVSDIDIGVRQGFLVPFTTEKAKEIVKVAEQEKSAVEQNIASKKKDVPKMKVVESDEDLMGREIDISWIKNKKAVNSKRGQSPGVVRTKKGEDIRGIEVLREEQPEYKEVATIKKPTVTKSKTTTKSSDSAPKKRAAKKTVGKADQVKQARLKQVAKNRKNMKKDDNA